MSKGLKQISGPKMQPKSCLLSLPPNVSQPRPDKFVQSVETMQQCRTEKYRTASSNNEGLQQGSIRNVVGPSASDDGFPGVPVPCAGEGAHKRARSPSWIKNFCLTERTTEHIIRSRHRDDDAGGGGAEEEVGSPIKDMYVQQQRGNEVAIDVQRSDRAFTGTRGGCASCAVGGEPERSTPRQVTRRKDFLSESAVKESNMIKRREFRQRITEESYSAKYSEQGPMTDPEIQSSGKKAAHTEYSVEVSSIIKRSSNNDINQQKSNQASMVSDRTIPMTEDRTRRSGTSSINEVEDVRYSPQSSTIQEHSDDNSSELVVEDSSRATPREVTAVASSTALNALSSAVSIDNSTSSTAMLRSAQPLKIIKLKNLKVGSQFRWPNKRERIELSTTEFTEEYWASRLGEDWFKVLSEECAQHYINYCQALVAKQRTEQKCIFPPDELVFSAFTSTPLKQVKIVIVGQDPYHKQGQAMGVAFSVPKGVKVPQSLINIYREIVSDKSKPPHGDLTAWTKLGVFLLNSVLTVEESRPFSHKTFGWEPFTDAVIRAIDCQTEHVVFMLWGNSAKTKGNSINRERHLVLESGHPSSQSIKQFAGCDHFNKANAYLKSHGHVPVDWMAAWRGDGEE